MKKIIVALIVIATASTAVGQGVIEPRITSLNGEPVTPTQEITVWPGDVVGFDIYLTGISLLSLDAVVSIDGPGTLDGDAIYPYPGGLTWPYNEGFNITREVEPGVAYAVGTAAFMAGMSDGMLIGNFLMHCDGAGDVIIYVAADMGWGGSFIADGTAEYSGEWGTAIVHGFGTVYVDADANGSNDGTSWVDAYNYLQDALAVGGDASLICVAEGIYYPDANSSDPTGSGERTATFQLINTLAIYGGFAGYGAADPNERDPNVYETVLSGDISIPADSSDNSFHVVTGSGTDSTAVLGGFTITAGNANGGGTDNYGAGMYNNSGSPTVGNCTFSDNSAWDGGGIYNDSSSPTVTGCTFIDNWANIGGGMSNRTASNPMLVNCAFYDNWASDGGGMYNGESSSPTLTDCNFTDNSATDEGGGIFNSDSSPQLTNCTFTGNSATNNGGGICNGLNSSPALTNCIFSGNTAELFGGAVYNEWTSSPTVTNCTFSGNSAGLGGGVYNTNDSSPTITNCILWGDTPDEIYVDSGSPAVTYSDVEGGYAGTGNIDDDPLFKDADGNDNIVGTEDDDLSLSYESPCIDAGDNTAVPADTSDLDGDGDTSERTPLDRGGNARFTDDPVIVDSGNSAVGYPEIVEMGAYERYEFCGGGAYPYPPGDVSGPDGFRDCHVNFYDVAVMAAHWLQYAGPE